MNLATLRNSLFALVATAGALICPTHGQAQTFTYHVDVNVAALINDPATAPYYLDFQLNGDGLPSAATNTVTLSNFAFTAGGATGAPFTFENAAGNLSAGVVLSLDANHTANEFYQQFTGATTDIQFNVTTTQNGSGITPDQFLVAILDKTTGQIATNAPDTVSLVSETINGAVTLANVQAYRSTNPVSVFAAVPEPSAWAAALLGAGVLAGVMRHRRSVRA